MKKINVVITNNESTDMDSFDNVSVDIVKKITNVKVLAILDLAPFRVSL